MPLYTFEDPATGKTVDLHLPVDRRDDGPPGWRRHTVPERIGHVGTLTSEDTHKAGKALNGFKALEQKAGGLDEIRRECGMGVDQIKAAWAAALVFLLLCGQAAGADLTTGYTFANGETNITAAKLNAAVNSAVINPAFIGNKSRPLVAQASDQILCLRGNNLYKLNLNQVLQGASNLNFYSFGMRVEQSANYPWTLAGGTINWANTNNTTPLLVRAVLVVSNAISLLTNYNVGDEIPIENVSVYNDAAMGSGFFAVKASATNISLTIAKQVFNTIQFVSTNGDYSSIGAASLCDHFNLKMYAFYPAVDPVFYVTNITQLTNQYYTTNVPDNSITSNSIAPNSIWSSHIVPGQVGTASFADGAVTRPKIAAAAVGTAQIDNFAVGTSQIADGSVTSNKFAAGILTGNVKAYGTVQISMKSSDGHNQISFGCFSRVGGSAFSVSPNTNGEYQGSFDLVSTNVTGLVTFSDGSLSNLAFVVSTPDALSSGTIFPSMHSTNGAKAVIALPFKNMNDGTDHTNIFNFIGFGL